jgi:hypothetical protein
MTEFSRFMSVPPGEWAMTSSFDTLGISYVGIATGYWLDDGKVGVRVPVGSRIFSASSRPDLGSTQPPKQWVKGSLSPGVKRQGREADHSTPTSA